MTAVSVIVPARDAAATIDRTLWGIERQTRRPEEVFVVDDGSRDDTVAVAERSSLRPTLIRRSQPAGAGPARNDGAAEATGDVLAFTDADCEPEPTWIERGMSAIAGADLVQGGVRPRHPPGPFDRTIGVYAERGLYETANLFVRRRLFASLGGFEEIVVTDPAREKMLGEDVWLGWRARRAGAVTAFAGDCVVLHEVFSQGPLQYVGERLNLRHFPLLAKRIPELRDDTFFMRHFLTRRSASFDAALAGAIAATLTRKSWPLLAGLPYVRLLERQSRRAGRRRQAPVAAVDLLADATACASLLRGSVSEGSLLI